MTNRKALLRVESLLAGAQLPALPQSAIRLLQLSQDPENGPAEFAVPIESDPGLTGQVLKVRLLLRPKVLRHSRGTPPTTTFVLSR